MPPTRRGAWLIVLCLPSCGVPALTIVGDDGGAADASPDGTLLDGAALDAPADDSPGDSAASADAHPDQDAGAADANDGAAIVAVCPDAAPPGAVTCCGAVPCAAMNASKCQGACTTCEQSCADGGLTCCIGTNGAFNGCRSAPSQCP